MDAQADGVLVATVAKNSREEVRVVRKDFEGHDLLDCRVWTLPAVPGGESTPTKKGLCLRPETWQELVAVVSSELGSGASGRTSNDLGAADGAG